MTNLIDWDRLFQIAKYSILKYLDDNIDFPIQLNYNLPQKATFVTLNFQNQLRGCVGSIIPNKSIELDVFDNARNAAFKDNRFPKLTQGELTKDLTLEISVLTIPEKMNFSSTQELLNFLSNNKPGLIISKDDYYQSTFLPDVWSQLPNPRDFLTYLVQKAGYNSKLYWMENPINWDYYIYYTENQTKNWMEIQ